MIKTYLLDCNFLYNKEIFEKSINILSDDRIKKTHSLKNEKDKILSVGSGLLLNHIFKLYGINENNKIIYNEYNKPYIEDNFIYFNLSHKDSIVVCTVCDSEIGVDIEKIKEADKKLMFYINKEEEFNNFKNYYSYDDNKAFYKLWTIKESFMKYLGKGLSVGIKDLVVKVDPLRIIFKDKKYKVFFKEHLYHDYVITICCNNIGEMHQLIVIENENSLLN